MLNWTLAAAYRAQGNGLIERTHRTIKRMAARSGRTVEEMTFWYNSTKGERPASPYEMLFAAKPRRPGIANRRQEIPHKLLLREMTPGRDLSTIPFTVGDLVYLKCDSDRPWSGPHRVTGLHSRVSVLLDEERVPRHISHIRRVPVAPSSASAHFVFSDGDESQDGQNDGASSDEQDRQNDAARQGR